MAHNPNSHANRPKQKYQVGDLVWFVIGGPKSSSLVVRAMILGVTTHETFKRGKDTIRYGEVVKEDSKPNVPGKMSYTVKYDLVPVDRPLTNRYYYQGVLQENLYISKEALLLDRPELE